MPLSWQTFFLRVAAISGAVAVGLGAFGAHFLKSRLAPDLLDVFEVGVRYQFYHTLAMMALALAGEAFWRRRFASVTCWCWLLGTIVFSGSLYVLSMTGLRWMGAITPIGGVLFIAGWTSLLFAAGATKAVSPPGHSQ